MSTRRGWRCTLTSHKAYEGYNRLLRDDDIPERHRGPAQIDWWRARPPERGRFRCLDGRSNSDDGFPDPNRESSVSTEQGVFSGRIHGSRLGMPLAYRSRVLGTRNEP